MTEFWWLTTRDCTHKNGQS